jgi:hypothetical protein
MLYGKIKDNQVAKFMQKPQWYFSDGTLVDDEYLANELIYKIPESASDYIDDYDRDRYVRSINNLNDLIINNDDKIITNYFKYTAKDISQVLLEKKNKIKELRDQKIHNGIIYTFPGDEDPSIIQTRDESDLRNIQACASAAHAYIMAGTPETIIKFRDEHDAIHELTAQQMLELSMYVMGHGQHIYEVSWEHKDNVSNFETIDEIIDYDIEQGW